MVILIKELKKNITWLSRKDNPSERLLEDPSYIVHEYDES